MLLYTTVGAHDLKTSYKFYDAVLKSARLCAAEGVCRRGRVWSQRGQTPHLGLEAGQPPAGYATATAR